MDIGTRIRDIRKARDLSQERLAQQAGVTLSLISKVETGRITDLHYSTLSGVARALGISVGELIGEVDAPKELAPTSPQPVAEELGNGARREREELTTALMHEGVQYAEDIEEKLEAMSDEMPLATVNRLTEHHLALRTIYEEIESTRQPSAELQEAYEKLEKAVSRVSRQVTQIIHPGTGDAYKSRKLFAERRAELLRGTQEERDERALGRGAG
jgi:transcriptional regulator with XRE-family HTH domain